MSQAMNMMADMAVANVSQSNVDNEKLRIRNLSNSKDSAQKKQELRKAAEGFEAIFIQKMWQQMRASVPKNGMHYSKEEEYWQSMYDQELGKSMAEAGGIGLADMMVEQLSQERTKTPQSPALSRIRMAVEPAPLVPNANLDAEKTASSDNAQKNTPIQNTQQNTKPINTATLYEQYDVSEQNTQQNLGYQSVAVASKALQEQEKTQNTAQAEQAVQNQQVAQEQAVQSPQIIRTTYITNLPPSKREHAILDRNGNPVKKVQGRQVDQEIPRASNYMDRSANPQKTTQNPQVNATQAQQNPIQQNQTNQTQNTQEFEEYIPQGVANTATEKKPEQNDILAGITTRYIPQAERMAMIQASAMLAKSGNSFYSPVEEGIENMPENLVASSAPIQDAESTKNFRIPSLDEALKMGTLVASLTEKEIAQVQNSKKENVQNTSKTTIGGGTVYSTPPVMENVSALAPKTEFAKPIDGTISSHFGWRLDPLTNRRAWHTGIDIKAEQGAKVTASQAGTVTFAGKDAELGNMIIIDHGNGIESIYGHNSELKVRVGDTVNTGTQIATVGASGRTNGAHLHFEIKQNGLSINPEPYLGKAKIS